jgi:hypothetical protein
MLITDSQKSLLFDIDLKPRINVVTTVRRHRRSGALSPLG